MKFIQLNKRIVRIICFLFGMVLAYIGYHELPVPAETTLGFAIESVGHSLDQFLGMSLLVFGSFMASISTCFEAIYAYRNWLKTRQLTKMINCLSAILVLALVVYLTWPGFQWALGLSVLAVLACLDRKTLYSKILKKKQTV
ncbi:hypothetical protein RDV78_01190 [Bacillota bacterium LX-D]|nr:hypothetical protein [Bacillota bacterium LX-D]